MGIRVHKVIGYGLTDLKCKRNARIKDPRIDPTGYLGVDCEVQEEQFTRKGYIEFLKGLRDSAPKGERFPIELELGWWNGDHFPRLKTWEPYESVKHDPEYGLPRVLLVCPPEMTENWQHYDKPIDYYEETLNHKQLNRFQLLPGGAYPYEGPFCDIRDGRALKDGIELRRVMTGMYKFKPPVKDEFAKKFGFKDFKEAKKYITPTVPDSVRFLCRYLRLFKDDSTIHTLKPMIYVYWS